MARGKKDIKAEDFEEYATRLSAKEIKRLMERGFIMPVLAQGTPYNLRPSIKKFFEISKKALKEEMGAKDERAPAKRRIEEKPAKPNKRSKASTKKPVFPGLRRGKKEEHSDEASDEDSENGDEEIDNAAGLFNNSAKGLDLEPKEGPKHDDVLTAKGTGLEPKEGPKHDDVLTAKGTGLEPKEGPKHDDILTAKGTGLEPKEGPKLVDDLMDHEQEFTPWYDTEFVEGHEEHHDWQVNPWHLDLKTVEKFSGSKEKDVLENLGTSAIKEVTAWNLADVIIRANKVLQCYQAADLAKPDDKKDVDTNIQHQVEGIRSAEKSTELARVATLYYHSQIAQTVESYQAPVHELRKGVGNKTICLNKYVEAKYPSSEEFARASLSKTDMKRRRNHWKKKKDSGDKIQLLIKAFGLGILLAVPSNMTASTFLSWSVGKTKLVIHALQAAPWAQQFQNVLDLHSGWLLDIIQVKLSASAIEGVSRVLRTITQGPTTEGSTQKPLTEIIDNFPQYHQHSVMLGVLCASPDQRDMQTLRSGEDVNDEIIRAVLGLELSTMPEPRTWQVLDPCWVSNNWNQTDRGFIIYEDTQELLIPVHHSSSEHWTLTQVSLRGRRTVYYDSLYTSSRMTQTSELVTDILASSGLDTYKNWKNSRGRACSQTGRDCGICVIANAVALMRGEELPKEVDGEAKRFEYAKLITEKFWETVCFLEKY